MFKRRFCTFYDCLRDVLEVRFSKKVKKAKKPKENVHNNTQAKMTGINKQKL